MTVVVFAGPSLTDADRASHPDFEWRGPAQAGDMLRLQATEGSVICLIDGFFDHRPSVRHKELLLLLSRGIAVLGASSMGALRAAEMDRFGMVGVGAIYRAYASGRLSGDDEVALVHATESWGWKGLSVPLVDCRANLHRALRAGFLTPLEVGTLLQAARAIHYTDRTWLSILEATNMTSARRRAVLDRIEVGGVSQKRLDALDCLAVAATPGLMTVPAPQMVRTSLVAALARECGLGPEALN
jgi:hypothetical protein